LIRSRPANGDTANDNQRVQRFISWRKMLAGVSLVAATTLITVPTLRTSVLQAAGRAVVAEGPVEAADIIVLTAVVGGAGVLEALDLVHHGVAARVAVFDDPPDDVAREFVRRGIPYEDPASRFVRQLRSAGIEAVETIPKAAAGSQEEARVLPGWCRQRGLRSVVVVSTADHSRRLGRMFSRAMEGSDTEVTVRFARRSSFNPDDWWRTRDGIRLGIVEFQKLLLDLAMHPVS
jgi:hypothetical protein